MFTKILQLFKVFITNIEYNVYKRYNKVIIKREKKLCVKKK